MTRAYVVHPAPSGGAKNAAADAMRAPQQRLREALSLTQALGVEVVGGEVAPCSSFRAATLLGSGKVEALKERIEADEIELVVVDFSLTPVQQRNLEKAWSAKVLDRTGLILEIFGDRAETSEGALQVELAHLEYQKSRLVRSWTHLERQRGGVGFMGGPGERQIESDRRQIGEKIGRLKRKLLKVAQTRSLHRSGRADPVVALVGYTNAGKSTLFNRLTASSVLAKDMLFATLDPTMRVVALPTAGVVVMSDTVGFISNLPTELVAAFRATLEEVLAADLIVHVRDIADAETEAQRSDVLTVLKEIGVDPDREGAVLEAWNKVDLLAPEAATALRNIAARDTHALCVSAATGEGVDALIGEIERRLFESARAVLLSLGPEDGAARAWLHASGFVTESHWDEETGRDRIEARMTEGDIGRFEKRFGPRVRFGLTPPPPRAAPEPPQSGWAP